MRQSNVWNRIPWVALLAAAGCGGGSVPTGTDSSTDAQSSTEVVFPDPGQTSLVPCDSDSECPPPGLCVAAPDGQKYCAPACSGIPCPEGWSCRIVDGPTGTVQVCLPPSDTLCRPCNDDADCRTAQLATRDYCVPFSPMEGSFCGQDCDPGDCPAGWICQEATTRGGATVKQCLPKTGECTCSPASIAGGYETPCVRAGRSGECHGVRTCTQSGLTACSALEPVAEVCGNSIDDDCDGKTDEPDCQGCLTWFLDGDGDGWGVLGQTKCLSAAEGGYRASKPGDCDDTDANVHPNVKETCNQRDDDCNGLTDDAAPTGCQDYWLDADADGYGAGQPQCLCAAQGKFTATKDGDCDDADPAVHPNGQESCGNKKDDDCNGHTDEPDAVGCKAFYTDADKDGHGVPGDSKCLCGPSGDRTATLGDDCDDKNPKAWPGTTEMCGNGVDEDCDGTTDEAGCQGCIPYYRDLDGDSWGKDGDSQCLSGPSGDYTAIRGGDCDDASAAVHPGAAETCNGSDDDCDGVTDGEGAEGCKAYFIDADKDGYGAEGTEGACLCAPAGDRTATSSGDCDDANPAVHPGVAEICNGLDDDCDGDSDPAGIPGCVAWYQDKDGDGWGTVSSKCLCEPSGDWRAPKPGDCDDGDPSAKPDGVEKCGTGSDEDCDGQTDEPGCEGCTTFFKDADGDGYGLAGDSQCLGAASGAYSATKTGDCNDGDPQIKPGATEICNKKDDDCDDQTDEGGVCVPRIGINADDGRTGGNETGACWCICEDDYNFMVAQKFQEWLEKDTANTAGGGTWSVFMARKSLNENPSLQARIDFFNNNAVDRIVSISGNSYPNPGCGTEPAGTETWITKSAGATTKDLANRVQTQTVAAFGSKDRGVKTDTGGTYAILDKTTAPSVFLFYGFVTNLGDVAKIKDALVRDALGLGLLYAIQQNYGLTKFKP